MKPRHALALSLAIGAPLWFQQYTVQRRLNKELRAYAEGLNKGMETFAKETNEQLNRWLDDAEEALWKAVSQ